MSRLQFGVTFTGSRFRFVFDTSSTPSRATAWLAVHRCTWSSYATPWLTFQQGASRATFSCCPRFSSWSLDIGRSDPGKEISLSPHHSCGTYFLPTSDFSITTINFSGRDSKLTICNSPCYATEDRCQQCELYYYYYRLVTMRQLSILGKVGAGFWWRDALPHTNQRQLGLGKRRWNLEDLFSGSWIINLSTLGIRWMRGWCRQGVLKFLRKDYISFVK